MIKHYESEPLRKSEEGACDEIGKKKQPINFSLYILAFLSCLASFGMGTIIAWTSPVISTLKSNNTNINPLGRPVSTLEISQIVGLFPIGGVLSPLLLTKFCDIIGRKTTIMALSFAVTIFTALLASATHVYVVLIARLMQGICCSSIVSSLSIFISEITEDHNRGRIGLFLALSHPMGNLFSYILGPLLSFRTFTLLCCTPFILNVMAFLFFIPESPVYYALKNRKEEAVKALKKIRRMSLAKLKKEYETIIRSIIDSEKNERINMLTLFKIKAYRKGMIISLGLCAIQIFTGVGVILMFAGPLFDQAKTGISGSTIGMLIGAVKMGAMLISSVIIEKSGRRPLLLFSTFCTSICLFSISLYFYLQSIDSPLLPKILWLPVASILLYCVVYSAGIGGIPMSLMSELFPGDVKTTAVSVVTFSLMLLISIISTIFPIVNELIGLNWCFFGFGFLTMMGTIFIYFVVPEIKGLNMLEIQEMLNK